MSEDIFSKPLSHHISDVDTWKHADRNYYLFVALTFLFGFFGLDHMYLRSNETAFKKFLLNVFGLGIWYIWDIIQVVKDGKTVRQHGLNSPFDWIRGIGRGMFDGPPAAGGKQGDKKEKEPEWAAPKSYFIYTILAVFLGIFGADKFYMGNTWQGVAKLFSVFNIFLFLFGLLWVAWDAFHAFFMTKSIMDKDEGITVPIPYKWLGFKPIVAKPLFEVKQVPEKKPEAKETSAFGMSSESFREAYRELIVPILQPSVGNAIQNASKVASVGSKVVGLGASALSTAPAFIGNLQSQMEAQTNAAVQQAMGPSTNAAIPTTPTPSTPQPQGTSIGAIQSIAQTAQASRQASPQTGGGRSVESSGPGPILAGAFTAIILAGGLKGFHDFLSKQIAV